MFPARKHWELLGKKSARVLFLTVYVDFGTELSEQVSLDFAFTGTSTVRTWEVKAAQIECGTSR